LTHDGRQPYTTTLTVPILAAMERPQEQPSAPSSETSPERACFARAGLACAAAACIGLAAVVVCFRPGYMSADSIDQLHQARSGVYLPITRP